MELEIRSRIENFQHSAVPQLTGAYRAQELGVELIDQGPGWAESTMTVRAEYGASNSQLYASVIETLAEYTGGVAASSLCSADKEAMTVGVEVTELRSIKAERFRCRSEVLKFGQSVVLVRSSVVALIGNEERLATEARVTVALV